MKINTSGDLTSSQLAIAEGTVFSGGNTSLPNVVNLAGFNPGMRAATQVTNSTAPFGMGGDIGANSDITDPYEYTQDQFGQYTLQQGVTMFAYAYGASGGMALGGAPGNADANGGYNGITQYAYATGTDFPTGSVDPAMAVLGGGWEQLRAGDTVHVKVIYTPTGTTIFSKDVPVTEA
jgi:hypothetical protein